MKHSDDWLKRAEHLLRETVIQNPYIPQVPTARQAEFLTETGIEALYGGAAGGGKSSSLLMGALQFADQPNYSAILFRKTFSDLKQPGSLIPRSIAWLGETDARWNGSDHVWTFPSGAVLKFGYLDGAMDIYQFQSADFQFIGFDELTQFREFDYRYMFSRLRKGKGNPIPLRVRSSSNPGGRGHEWVKRRFIQPDTREDRIFIPARISDNPHLDREAYLQSLSHLDPVTRQQLERGDWTARASGSMFKREWFTIVPEWPQTISRWVRFWDLAASAADGNNDPDWTCGALLTVEQGVWWMRDLRRFRGTPKEVEDNIRQTAMLDPRGTRIRMEQEPGASGKSTIDHYRRNILAGYDFDGIPSRRDKVTRAGPFSSAAEAGNFRLIQGAWNSHFLDEVEAFKTEGIHDDSVDATTGAMAVLTEEQSSGHSRSIAPVRNMRGAGGGRRPLM